MQQPYIFREEDKPRFKLSYSGLIAMVVLLLLIWFVKEEKVFQVSAAEVARLEELQRQQEREMVFRFSDEPEDDVTHEDPKFLSDANRIFRSPQKDEAPNEHPDPYSKGDTFDLKKAQKPSPNTQPQPPIVQPKMVEVPQTKPPEKQEETEDPQKEFEKALPDEPEEIVASEQTSDHEADKPAEEVAENTPDPNAAGELPQDPFAPKPYRKLSTNELALAKQKAMDEINIMESAAANSRAENSSFDNPLGSRGPELGLTVETSRSDLGEYLKILRQLIKGNWRIPNIARYEVAGVAGIFFKIHKDGTISDVYVGSSSSHEPLDIAALNAVNNTNPAPALPDHVDEDWIPIKFGFYYNMRPRF